MYLAACGFLLAIALGLNLQDRRMLALTVAVGVSVFIPVPAHTQAQFYGTCILAELTVASLAVFYTSRGSTIILYCCAGLVISHFMGWILDGNPPLSPYRIIVKILEFSQLAGCVALSPAFTPILRNRDATPTP